MSGNQYLSSNKSSFFSIEDDDDIADDDFLKLSREKDNRAVNAQRSQINNDMERNRQMLIQKQKEIEQNTILSSKRAIQLLQESEDIGIATADELHQQREQLERTDKTLDEINGTLKQSQKHIQGIKSVFGGIKNWWSSPKADKTPSPSSTKSLGDGTSGTQNTSNGARKDLHEAIGNAKKNNGYDHPALRLRGVDDPSQSQQKYDEPTDSQAILDQNLDQIGSCISRIKGLALGLGEEIEQQNDLVERIIVKSEKADINIQRQNKDMNRLLKK